MDGSRFDAWTRRRVGLVTGSFAGALVAMLGHEETEAKKKRCRKPAQSCKSSGKKKRCCKDLLCQKVEGFSDVKVCCKDLGKSCSLDTDKKECCSGVCIGECICKSQGSGCDIDANCCAPLLCISGQCVLV